MPAGTTLTREGRRERQCFVVVGGSVEMQNRVRDVLREVMASTREDLLKQFSSADASNPLAEFKARTVEALRAASDQQAETLRGVEKRMADLRVELQALRDQRHKDEELEAERERGTAKGRTFEEAVYEAIDAIASGQGDDCEAVGDLRGATGKTGDVVAAIDACGGPARGRIVFEAKNAKLSKRGAFEELDRGMREREADFAVLVVPAEDKLPAKTRPPPMRLAFASSRVTSVVGPCSDDRSSWRALALRLA